MGEDGTADSGCCVPPRESVGVLAGSTADILDGGVAEVKGRGIGRSRVTALNHNPGKSEDVILREENLQANQEFLGPDSQGNEPHSNADAATDDLDLSKAELNVMLAQRRMHLMVC